MMVSVQKRGVTSSVVDVALGALASLMASLVIAVDAAVEAGVGACSRANTGDPFAVTKFVATGVRAGVVVAVYGFF